MSLTPFEGSRQYETSEACAFQWDNEFVCENLRWGYAREESTSLLCVLHQLLIKRSIRKYLPQSTFKSGTELRNWHFVSWNIQTPT